MLRPRIKQPGEERTLDVRVDLAAGVSVVSVSGIVVVARGLVAEVDVLTAAVAAIQGNVVQVTLAGGTDEEIYLVTVTSLDDADDVRETEAEIHVLDLGFAVPDAPSDTLYIEPLAYVHRFGLEEAVRLTDEHGLGRIDKRVLWAAITDATAEVDSYLAGRYVVPMAPVPTTIIAVTADLARERLHALSGASESVTQRAAAARRQLKDLAAGVARLPGATQQSSGSDTPLVDAPARVFTRDTMAGF